MKPRLMDRRDALRLAGGGALALAGCREPANAIRCRLEKFHRADHPGRVAGATDRSAHRAARRPPFQSRRHFFCHQALLAGQLDLYPEYTGTALTAILKEPPANDPADVYQTVRDAYRDRFDLDVGPPLGFNNTFAIVVRGEDARRLHLRTISDLVPYAPKWRAGFGYEFMERPDGYRGWAKAYGLAFRAQPRIMDLGLLYRALQEKQVDVVAGNSTDGLIAALGMVVLEDDRRYFPPYQAVTVVRDATFDRHPELRGVLDALGGKISDDDMRQMNYAVDGQHRDVTVIVRDFRAAHQL